MNKPMDAFTTSYEHSSPELVNAVDVNPYSGQIQKSGKVPSDAKQYNAIWDTGATGSVITSKVVAELGLKPVGKAKVNTANGVTISNVYFVNLFLINHVCIQRVRATESTSLSGNSDVLIGMDIITLGDFAVSTFDGKTSFSFRMPSMGKIDFVRTPPQGIAPRGIKTSRKKKISTAPISLSYPGVARKAPCPCGSGKKHKRCCWDKPSEKNNS